MRLVRYGLADKYIKQSELSDYLDNNDSGGMSDNISIFVQTTPEGDTEDAMNFDEFLATNPEAKKAYDDALTAKYNAGVEDGKKELQERINVTANYLSSKEYAGAIQTLAISVLKGEKKPEALEGAVAAFDMMKENSNSNAAKNETDALGDTTPSGDDVSANENGEIKNPAQFSAEVKRYKGVR